ncbi:sugar ABC transporter ATP-binding protein [uncultured Sphaerochaeta sp.]|uniref:sugar ABC transporter ATP-binding protein n=1 Tax=uncultured Sphaerochaeta sp. TaxID=886478 RepID=UPI002A0A4C86|nr:sugar ABC transporter ATP-binding protein [uncultured Sphaerochaeta sp.]
MNPKQDPTNSLYAEEISKYFPGTKALDRVSFAIKRGKVNVLIGENGAGKSTLMKVIAGIVQPTSGKLYMDGEVVSFSNTIEAKARGIAIIHQELNLFPNMNIFQNIFVGAEITKKANLLDDKTHSEKAKAVLELLGHPLDPSTIVGNLSVGQKQIVEIARNLIDPDLRVLIMDEPTSSLSAQEVEILFDVIRDLKSRGIAIVYISHRLEELMQIGDNLTILRDGCFVDSAEVKDIDVHWIVEKMVGNNKGYNYPERKIHWESRKKILEVHDVCLPKKGGGFLLDHVNFDVKKGEILAIYGLLGAGRTELLECIMGVHQDFEGEIYLHGKPIKIESFDKQVEKGFAMIPEDRQKEGLVQSLSVKKNISLSSMQTMTSKGILSSKMENDSTQKMIKELHIKVADSELPILSLSGGNQQKVVIARGILTDPKVLLLDEPSRGIDVGAKSEVFDIIRSYADKGLSIVFSSSELKEVTSIADRVLVLSNGKITGDFPRSEISEQKLVSASYLGHGIHK